MNTVITIAGYVFLGLIALAILWAVWETFFEIGEIGNGDGYIFMVFGFGVVRAKPGTLLHHNCNHVRLTKDKEWFFTAPAWFNRYVANLGGVKKPTQKVDNSDD